MASTIKDRNRSTNQPNGCYTIQFTAPDGKRKSLRLGKVTHKAATGIKIKVESLIAAKFSQQSWDPETAAWVGKLEPVLYDKIAAVGLLPAREEAATTTLEAFLDAFIDGQDVKHSTSQVYGHTRRCLVEYFGASSNLAAITPGDADDFRKWLGKPINKKDPTLGGQGLAPNTVRRRCGIARQFFNVAIRKELISRNPFANMREGVSVKANRDRDHIISREDADAVLAACPDTEWRLIFALSRFGGLRCPSEHMALRWADINWAEKKITVTSPKTEHHEGHESRVMPLFPVLEKLLSDAFHEAPDGAEYVITKYRGEGKNLRTHLLRIIKRAGLKPWPKLFQNLRATRATELAAEFPAHVAASFLGHSVAIAQKHYWQTTETDFEKALRIDEQNDVQKAKQYGAKLGRMEPKSESEKLNNPREIADLVGSLVGDEGLEPPTSTL